MLKPEVVNYQVKRRGNVLGVGVRVKKKQNKEKGKEMESFTDREK